MSTEKPWPRVRDASRDTRTHRLHPEIDVMWGEHAPAQRFCGDNWCDGRCGLPALVIPWPDCEGRERFAKASGSQVACGPLMQAKRCDWTGPRVEVPEEMRSELGQRIWF